MLPDFAFTAFGFSIGGGCAWSVSLLEVEPLDGLANPRGLLCASADENGAMWLSVCWLHVWEGETRG